MSQGLVRHDDSSQWLALYVRARHEKQVSRCLAGKGYELFLPTYIHTRTRSRKSELPLFPGYVFCRSAPADALPLLSTPGVLSIVSRGNTPALVPEDDLQRVRDLLAKGLDVQPWPYLAPGDEVSINTGPLRGMRGVVIDARQQRWIVISLHMLRRSVGVRVERIAVQGLANSRLIEMGAAFS
jgi:transcription antitermination factor NusG